MKVRLVFFAVFLLLIIIGYCFVEFITPKMMEKEKSESQLYFDSCNYDFKATILDHHQLNAYTSGVLKLKFIKGEIDTHKNYIKNITTGTFNTKDSVMYAFVTFYPKILSKLDKGINPIIVEMNSKSKIAKLFIDQDNFYEAKIYYYGDDSFKKRAFLDFLKKNKIKNDLFW